MRERRERENSWVDSQKLRPCRLGGSNTRGITEEPAHGPGLGALCRGRKYSARDAGLP